MIWATFPLRLDLSAQRCGCMHNVKLRSSNPSIALVVHVLRSFRFRQWGSIIYTYYILYIYTSIYIYTNTQHMYSYMYK